MTEGNVRQRGDKWYYSFETAPINGKRHRIERVGGYTQKDAERALRRALDDYEKAGTEMQLTNMSVADYINYWFVHYVKANLKYNTVHNYQNVKDKYIIPPLGGYKVQSLSPETMQQWIDWVVKNGKTPQGDPLAKHTVEIIFTVMKEALRRAVYPYRIIRENPMGYIDMPRFAPTPQTTRAKLKIITLDQYKQILEMYPPADSFHLPLVIAFNTGMRRGEVCGLEWDKVNLSDGIIEVSRNMIQTGSGVYELGTPKTAAGFRTIEIGPTLISALKDQKKHQIESRLRYGSLYHETNFVCTKDNGDPVLPGSIKYKSSEAQKKLGFPFNFHSLRHTHATMLLEAGEKMKVVQERLGHSRIAVTMDTYSHVTKSMKKNTVNLIEEIQRRSE